MRGIVYYAIMVRDKNNVVIVGQGYVGLPLAMSCVFSGWQVTGIDINSGKIDQICSGVSPVEDVPQQLLSDALDSGLYTARSDFDSIAQANIVVICVPTPLLENGSPDLSYLNDAVDSIIPFLVDGTLIINESTSYPGTLREIFEARVLAARPDLVDVLFAVAPERVNPGDKKWNQMNTPRIVGGINNESKRAAVEFYQTFCGFLVEVDSPEIAEAAKLFENTFRLVNISLVNEFAQICSTNGINVHEVIDAAATKPYGFMPFSPGIGIGGHCIPVDPNYLTWWARRGGSQAELVELSFGINRRNPNYIAGKAFEIVKEIFNPRVLILGVTYKAGISDTRESPVKDLFERLQALKCDVSWFDPLVQDWEGRKKANRDWKGDLIILAVNQVGLDLEIFLDNSVPILDCTNTLQGTINVYKP
jgi:UDP-N-acetyl-D-glucosamine dehydrogenase